MSARTLVGVGLLARAAWPRLLEAGHRRGAAALPRGALVPVLAVAAVAVVTLMVRAFGGRVLTPVALAVLTRFGVLFLRTLRRGRVWLFAHPGDGLADQLLDHRDASAVGGRNDGDGGAAPSGTPGAADAMHIVVGVVRDVEVEDVADRGNVEAARGDVGGDQQRDFVLAELIERGRARRLVHSPCSAIAEKPWRTSERCSAATSRLRLQKMIALVKPSAERMTRRSVSRLSCGSRPVLTSNWVVVATVVAGRETSTFTGLCRNCSVMRRISGGMVAVKNNVWRVNGTSLQMRSMSGMKPMSSMRSASSITRSSTPDINSRPRSQ